MKAVFFPLGELDEFVDKICIKQQSTFVEGGDFGFNIAPAHDFGLGNVGQFEDDVEVELAVFLVENVSHRLIELPDALSEARVEVVLYEVLATKWSNGNITCLKSVSTASSTCCRMFCEVR